MGTGGETKRAILQGCSMRNFPTKSTFCSIFLIFSASFLEPFGIPVPRGGCPAACCQPRVGLLSAHTMPWGAGAQRVLPGSAGGDRSRGRCPGEHLRGWWGEELLSQEEPAAEEIAVGHKEVSLLAGPQHLIWSPALPGQRGKNLTAAVQKLRRCQYVLSSPCSGSSSSISSYTRAL